MIEAEPAAPFEATYDSGTSGLAGTVEVRIDDNQGATVFGPTAAGIIELGVTGIYSADLTAPGAEGQYTILFSDDGTFAAGTGGADELLVVPAGSTGAPPPLAPLSGDGFLAGPCRAWTSTEAIMDCCPAAVGESVEDELEEFRDIASEVLWEASGREHSGECGPTTYRPCAPACGCWPVGVYGYSWDGRLGRWSCGPASCGCRPTSEVRLPGYPVREIIEVKIDGVALDEDEYRLDDNRTLVRMRDAAEPNTRLSWPACQIMDLNDTEEGTFAVTYTYGADPPRSGQAAAAALACQLYAACTEGVECELPENVVRVVRAGITFEKVSALASLLLEGATGIAAIDTFIAGYGTKRKRAPVVFSPDLPWGRNIPAGGS